MPEKKIKKRFLKDILTTKIDFLGEQFDHEVKRLDAGQRKLGALFENIDSKFRLMIEGFGALDRHMEIIDQSLQTLAERMEDGFAMMNEKMLDKVSQEEFLALKKEVTEAR